MKEFTRIRGEDFFLGKSRPEQRALEPKSPVPSSLVHGGKWHGHSRYKGSRKHHGPVKQYSAEQIAQLNMKGTIMDTDNRNLHPIADAIADAEQKMKHYKIAAAAADREYSRWASIAEQLRKAEKMLTGAATKPERASLSSKESTSVRVARNRALIGDAVRQLHGASQPVTEAAVAELLIEAGLAKNGARLSARAAAKRGELK